MPYQGKFNGRVNVSPPRSKVATKLGQFSTHTPTVKDKIDGGTSKYDPSPFPLGSLLPGGPLNSVQG
jgi:hypothetical protein